MDRAWHGLFFNETDFEKIETAFTGPDGRAYFFSDEKFTSTDAKVGSASIGEMLPVAGLPAAPIRDFWGISDNEFLQNSHVDAAFVDGAGLTYLFSTDQFVRYSQRNYRFADDGFPKQIVGELRKEAAFANLPEGFD